ncbi:MAG: SDR family NAD(P)-dependent oxidoreductase [Pseudomonadota bacterium]
MARFDGRGALITGAASGIGRHGALRLAAEGAAIMCADLDGEGAARTAAMIDQQGGKAQACALDVTDEKAYAAALADTASAFGGVRVLFNNAGIGGGDLEWEPVINVNLNGVANGMFHAAPLIEESGGGAIINTASIAGLVGLVGAPPAEGEEPLEMSRGAGAYIASKHAVAGLTKQYAIAWGPRGVRVNAIAPGYIETPMTAEMRETPEGHAFLEGLHPIGRLGQPEEIAAALAFLASDDASFVNGVVLPVDGGYTAR